MNEQVPVDTNSAIFRSTIQAAVIANPDYL